MKIASQRGNLEGGDRDRDRGFGRVWFPRELYPLCSPPPKLS